MTSTSYLHASARSVLRDFERNPAVSIRSYAQVMKRWMRALRAMTRSRLGNIPGRDTGW